jgi:hypothetical protein
MAMNDRIEFSNADRPGVRPAGGHAKAYRPPVSARRISASASWWLRRGLCRLLIAFLVSAGLTPIIAVPSVQSAAVGAKESAARVYRIKAAYLYNFAKFTEWPGKAFSTERSALRLCVLGDVSFGAALRTIDGREVGGRELRVRHIDGASEVANCHLLFVGTSEASHVRQILKSVGDAPVLTISDITDFATIGGVIRLKTIRNKIRFEINQTAAEHLGLKLSSKLLRLADIVRNRPDQERSGARAQ